MAKHPLRTSVLGILFLTQLSVALAGAQDAGQVPKIPAELGEGITLTPLAGELVHWPDATFALQSIPIQPGSSMDGRAIPPELSARMDDVIEREIEIETSAEQWHLVYVQSGEATIAADGKETIYHQGDNLVVPAGPGYEIRNDVADCATLLRLVSELEISVGSWWDPGPPSEVPNLPVNCGETGVLDRGSMEFFAALDPTLMFVARMRWEPDQTQQYWNGHPGWVMLFVESGTLRIRENSNFASQLTPGGWISIPAGQSYSATAEGAEPAVALIVGAVAAEYGISAPSYIVDEFGSYAVVWDESEPWYGHRGSQYGAEDPKEYLLESWEYEAWVAFDQVTDADDCLDDAVADIRSKPGVSHVEQLSDFATHDTDDAGAAESVASYAYDEVDYDGITHRYVAYIECFSTLQIVAHMPFADRDAEFEHVTELLNGLMVHRLGQLVKAHDR